MNNFHKYGGWIISDEISMRDDEKVNFFSLSGRGDFKSSINFEIDLMQDPLL